MSVWFCIPSARPLNEANRSLYQWRAKGYKVALWRDLDELGTDDVCNLLLTGTYPGYALAVNALVGIVLNHDPSCNWVVLGGDDMEPDPNYLPEHIAAQCEARFGSKGTHDPTFGVMQPTGDRWGEGNDGALCDRVAGSPWIGRSFCKKINGGHGPLWHEYFHMGVDEELQQVAIRLGVFWQRPDLRHFHAHWARSKSREMPKFLAKANSPQEWEKYRRTFMQRQAAGFPGHEPT